MDAHDEPHDRKTCPRCVELRRQEFSVPGEPESEVPVVTFLPVPRWRDRPGWDDPELLWGEPPAG